MYWAVIPFVLHTFL